MNATTKIADFAHRAFILGVFSATGIVMRSILGASLSKKKAELNLDLRKKCIVLTDVQYLLLVYIGVGTVQLVNARIEKNKIMKATWDAEQMAELRRQGEMEMERQRLEQQARRQV
ncbi:hypothetical protein KVV02_002707 [Mortierella alpina]|uniref:Uncharacterized protein n=1 Tax=Mortierella alpina TaxID=64518 RepID=A0A9P8D2E6_MORAP|nr:hypothetical protein KVV02_002707 [Mortierella alpina]